MIDLTQLPNKVLLYLSKPIDRNTANPQVTLAPAEPLRLQIDSDPNNDIDLTEGYFTFSPDKQNPENGALIGETMYLVNGAYDPVRGVFDFDCQLRGLINTHKNDPPTAADARGSNRIDHAQNAYVKLDNTWAFRKLAETFEVASTTLQAEAGAAITPYQSVSIHTDGLLYPYDSTTYPNVVGVSDGNTYNPGDTVTYTTYGGAVTGLSGLTPGDDVFAEDVGQIVQTSSATTEKIGKATSATTVQLSLPGDPLQKADQAEAEAGVDNGKYMTPLRTKEALESQFQPLLDASEIPGTGIQQSDFPVFNSSGSFSTGDFIFFENLETNVSGTVGSFSSRLGDSATRERQALRLVGNGVSMTAMDIGIEKIGTPTDNIDLRLETDNAGEPSGTLVDPNATATVNMGTIANAPDAVTFAFAGPVAVTDGDIFHVVLQRDGALDASNYPILLRASVGGAAFQAQSFDGAVWGSPWRGFVADGTGFYKTAYSDYDTVGQNFAGVVAENGVNGDIPLVNLGDNYDYYSGLTVGQVQFVGNAEIVNVSSTQKYRRKGSPNVALSGTLSAQVTETGYNNGPDFSPAIVIPEDGFYTLEINGQMQMTGDASEKSTFSLFVNGNLVRLISLPGSIQIPISYSNNFSAGDVITFGVTVLNSSPGSFPVGAVGTNVNAYQLIQY